MKAKMIEMEHEAKQERERTEVERVQKLTALTDRLQLTPDASADDRAGWEQEVKGLQHRVTIPAYK